MALTSLFGLDPATYERHPVHREGRSYTETNCYTDIVVELLHARGDEPLAVLGCLTRQDFEGDQFTFFKPPPGDLEALFGVDIHEMNPWRSLPELALRQLELGRTVIVELDAFHLPDVRATDYRTNHVKTSVVVEGIDPEAERLVYWHNAGLYELSGEDYRAVLRTEDVAPEVLVPYVEVVRFDAGPRLRDDALRGAARGLLRAHLDRAPEQDPFAAFGERLAADLPGLLEGDAAGFHAYAFPTVRMAGAAAELLADHAVWLAGADAAAPATAALGRVVDASKVLSFRLARRRAFDPAPMVAEASAGWQTALDELRRLAA